MIGKCSSRRTTNAPDDQSQGSTGAGQASSSDDQLSGVDNTIPAQPIEDTATISPDITAAQPNGTNAQGGGQSNDQSIDTFTPAECENYFSAAGYDCE